MGKITWFLRLVDFYIKIILIKLGELLFLVSSSSEVKLAEPFDKEFNNLKLIADDLIELKQYIKDIQPKAALGSQLYKQEWTSSRLHLAKGKYRVIYLNISQHNLVFLLKIYSKKQKSDLTRKELEGLRRKAKDIIYLINNGGR